MAAQNEQKSLANRPNEQQGQSIQRRRSYFPEFGIAPQEFFSSNPFSLMRRMTEEMDRAFQEFGMNRGDWNRTGWSPSVEVFERDGKYNVYAELPGLSPNDVKVEVADNALVIQGERKVEHEDKEQHRTERQYGSFYRSIPLPEGADVEHANAKFQNGLLEISVPVPQQSQQRRSIPIEGGSKQPSGTQKQAA